MVFTDILFYLFALILLGAALRVITTRNPVHAVLYLVLAFFTAAALWILLKAEFLALVLLLVYVGAVMVLFLFVVMMLDINLDALRAGFRKNLLAAIPVGLLIVFEMSAVLLSGFPNGEAAAPVSDTIGLTRALGRVLYSDYLYPFEIAAAILMVAIVAAVALTLRKRNDAIYTSASKALKATKQARLRVVEMTADTAYGQQAVPKAKQEGEQP